MVRRTERRLDQIIKQQLFRVDLLACSASAGAIQAFRAADSEEDLRAFSRATLVTFNLALVAICHQINWDYLEHSLRHNLLCRKDKALDDILAEVDARDIGRWLASYHRPERIRAGERAALLRDIGQSLRDRGLLSVLSVAANPDSTIHGEHGFVRQLDQFKAYREDPLKKKSYVLVQELVRRKLASFSDADHIQPAVDYHIMRLYLRSGRVVPLHPEVARILRQGQRPRPRLVRLLREAVAEALRATALYARLSVPEVNYIEWQIGRALCISGRPMCLDEGKKISIDPNVAALTTNRCPYSQFCPAYRHIDWLRLKEPNYVSSLY